MFFSHYKNLNATIPLVFILFFSIFLSSTWLLLVLEKMVVKDERKDGERSYLQK